MAIVKKKKDRPKFERIISLGADKVAQIDAMLFKNIDSVRVAHHIQDIWGDFDNVNIEALTKQLKRYKESEVVGRWLTQVIDDNGVVKDDYMKPMFEAKAQLNAHDMLQDLVIVQQERMNKVYTREKKLPTNMDTVRKDIETYGKLLGQLAGLQMDLGYITRVPLKIQSEIKPIDESVVIEAERVDRDMEILDAQVIAANKAIEIMNQ